MMYRVVWSNLLNSHDGYSAWKYSLEEAQDWADKLNEMYPHIVHKVEGKNNAA